MIHDGLIYDTPSSRPSSAREKIPFNFSASWRGEKSRGWGANKGGKRKGEKEGTRHEGMDEPRWAELLYYSYTGTNCFNEKVGAAVSIKFHCERRRGSQLEAGPVSKRWPRGWKGEERKWEGDVEKEGWMLEAKEKSIVPTSVPTIRNSKIDSDRCCSLLDGKKPGWMKEYFHAHFSLPYFYIVTDPKRQPLNPENSNLSIQNFSFYLSTLIA